MAQVFKILCLGDSLTEGYMCWGLEFHPYTIKLEQKFKADGHQVQVSNKSLIIQDIDSIIGDK